MIHNNKYAEAEGRRLTPVAFSLSKKLNESGVFTYDQPSEAHSHATKTSIYHNDSLFALYCRKLLGIVFAFNGSSCGVARYIQNGFPINLQGRGAVKFHRNLVTGM